MPPTDSPYWLPVTTPLAALLMITWLVGISARIEESKLGQANYKLLRVPETIVKFFQKS